MFTKHKKPLFEQKGVNKSIDKVDLFINNKIILSNT